ncbi:MAG: type II toxin-antitoxin system prevent-host-death family antitoxin [Syntrophales bacterium LBB04]|nr:type II toxin-antitoxin system prevent-host-death family antitoxin [Syntrophales bacterium LBB04]
MKKAGVREVRLHFSRYLQEVKRGEPLIITERGEGIAQILPLSPNQSRQEKEIQDGLRRLAEKGFVQLPSGQKLTGPAKRIKVQGKPFSDAVIEDRR